MIWLLVLAALAVLVSQANAQGVSDGGAVESVFGGKLDAGAIYSLAINAGFVDPDATTAAAVALAESGGDPQAYNPEVQAGTPAGLGSVGLWQIYLKAHPEYQGVNLNDPQTNANAAFAVYSQAGNSFQPWSTYKSGAYAKYLPEVQAAV